MEHPTGYLYTANVRERDEACRVCAWRWVAFAAASLAVAGLSFMAGRASAGVTDVTAIQPSGPVNDWVYSDPLLSAAAGEGAYETQ